MNNIIYVFSVALEIANTRLTFAPFSFSIAQFFCAMLIGSIIISFIHKIFD